MIHLLLGPDDYSKKLFIDSIIKLRAANLTVFRQEEILPSVGSLSQADLFSGAKVFHFDGVLPDFSKGVPDMNSSINSVVISVTSVDKRKKENKDLLASPFITTKQFDLPHGTELDSWILNRVAELDGIISKSAASSLAKVLGRDSGRETKIAGKIISVEEIFNLWLVENEIRKLIALADGKEISEVDIKNLVSENREVDAFEITNAIADGKKAEAISLLKEFLKSQSGSDEKGSIIQLNALLAEQFRNAAMVSDFVALKKSEDEILEITGWKSGRLFVMKKIASRFPQKRVLDTLTKLEYLDEELKTSSTPPKVLLDLIISQFFIV